MNRAIIVGRLTRDPNIRTTQSDIKVATFTVAVNRPFTNQDGEREADFINVVAFRKTAENIEKYVAKGDMVGIDGRIQTRDYEKEGNRVFVTEIVADNVQFLETKRKEKREEPKEEPAPEPIREEDLPF